MKPTTYDNGKPLDHFVRVPNELVDHQGLTVAGKLVLVKLASHGFGKSTQANPSQLEIAKSLRLSRNTVNTAIRSLTEFGLIEPHGEGHQGKQETYTVHLERLSTVPQTRATCSNGAYVTCSNGAYVGAKHAQSVPIKHTHSKTVENTRAESEVASAAEVADDGGLDGIYGNALLSQDEEHAQSVPMLQPAEHCFSKKQINEYLLAPDGKRPDVDGLESDLCGILGMAESDYFPSSELDKLVAAHGAEYCAFWASWLPRKIAAEYEASRPVQNPAGLYRRAVEGRWKVDPSWPPFDEIRHTDAAWKVKNGIGTAAGDEEGIFKGDLCPF